MHIGNDIVDLTDPLNKGKSQDARFINRIFTPAEKAYIGDAEDPDKALWALWAAKETVYKILKKSHPSHVFSPRSYEVTIYPAGGIPTPNGLFRRGGVFAAVAVTPLGKIPVRIFSHRDFILCIGASQSAAAIDTVTWGVENFSAVPTMQSQQNDNSHLIRKALKKHLALLYDWNEDEIEIRRSRRDSSDWGPPEVYLRKKKAPLDITLSHDGHFGSYAFRHEL